MKKFFFDIYVAWKFFWWHRSQKPPELSRGKVIGDAVCSTDVRFKHPGYDRYELCEAIVKYAAENLISKILGRPYKLDLIVDRAAGHNNVLTSMMATPVQDTTSALHHP